MSVIRSFEDIVAWQKARELTREIYRLCSMSRMKNQFALADQMRRASVSIMANIAEGFERGGDGEFKQFLSVAKGSAAEVRSHLYVALDAELISREDFDRLQEIAVAVGQLIGAFMRYLRGTEQKGYKFQKPD